MTTRIYGFTALTGGGTGALDKYPESGMPALATDDYAFGHVDGAFYLYWFDGASSEAESPPDVIAPNSGSGRWILKSFSSNHNDLMNIDGGNASPEEYYHLASALYNVINSATAQSIIANPTGGATSVTNVTVAEQTLVGRITGGNVDDLSVAQVKTLIGDVSDTAYASSWNGVTDVAPSKNAVYDELYVRPRRNAIINGNMSVWQRGTSATPLSGVFVVDRFAVHKPASDCTYNVECETVTISAGFPFKSALKIVCTHEETAVANNEYLVIAYNMEGYDFIPFEGNTATLSFWVKATKIGIYCVKFGNSTGTQSYVAEYTVNVTNTWEKKTITLTFNSGGTFLYTNMLGLQVTWAVFCGSDFHAATKDTWLNNMVFATSNQVTGFDTANNTFSITGVQLELGSVATAFEDRPFAEELALCQRYYEKSYAYGVYAGAVNVGSVCGISNHLTVIIGDCDFKVSKRAAPVVYIYSYAGTVSKVGNIAGADTGAAAVAYAITENRFAYVSDPGSPYTKGDLYYYNWTASAEI